ncbi:RNA-guided endonuclease TnpB family protein [Streptomyces mirabilis]|uniref:RNA-guided endonuclease TnpB family protein n=1 Tax=Streptomyces mirabilis TaxID=68239 RepID=UPI0036B123D1
MKAARAHAQLADARREFHHQLSTQLIRENQAVAVEDLAVKGLARTRLGKSVHDADWAQFLAMLEYKAQRYARVFVKVGRFEPTSQVCSVCGAKDSPKPLHVRAWTCTHCGTVHDRDHNAAKNVKQAAGLAVTACRAQVRPELVPAPRDAADAVVQAESLLARASTEHGRRRGGHARTAIRLTPCRVDGSVRRRPGRIRGHASCDKQRIYGGCEGPSSVIEPSGVRRLTLCPDCPSAGASCESN